MADHEAPAAGRGTFRPFHLAGAVAAVVSGSVVTWLARAVNEVAPLTNFPVLILLGLLAAAFLGAAFAAWTVAAPRFPAVLLAFAVGLLTPAIVAGVVGLPIAPIAILFSPVAWPLTMPAAIGWLFLVRWPRTRIRLERPAFAVVALALSGALLGLRYTQPFESTGPGGGRCIAFPGESIETIAWSPDGEWLGIGSERSYVDGIVRVMRASSGEITQLVRGEQVEAAWPNAVGPGGAISYQVLERSIVDGDTLYRASLWEVAPGVAPRFVAELPSEALVGLAWTQQGIVGVLGFDPETQKEIRRAVWVRPDAELATLVPMTEAEAGSPSIVTLMQVYLEPIRAVVDGMPHTIPWPPDASGSVVLSEDGSELIFQARRYTDEGVDLYNHLVAQSVATGRRVVLLEAETSEARVAGDRLAYIESAAFTDNRLCVVDLPAT